MKATEPTLEDPKLIQSYVRNRWFVSTALRECSSILCCEYYETMVWEWDKKNRERGDLIWSTGGSRSIVGGLKAHVEICGQLLERGEIKEQEEA